MVSGELLGPCFALTFDEKSIEVWYDMMVEDDQTKRPVVSVEGIENGNMVIVTGELKSGTWTAPSNTFWANNMNKTLPHVDFLEYIILWITYY